MPRANITVRPAPYNAYGGTPAADAIDDVWTGADVANGQMFIGDQKNLVKVKNTHATNPGTFTITGYKDEYGATPAMGPYTLQAGESADVLVPGKNFIQGTGTDAGKIYVNGSITEIQFCIKPLP